MKSRRTETGRLRLERSRLATAEGGVASAGSRRSTVDSARGPRAGTQASRAGYTLLELLVAMTIMVMLGAALVALLKQGITTWHTAEKRGAILERAQVVLDQVAEDLRAAAGDSRAEGAGFWVRFLCDVDPQGRPRLRFTRAISGEAEDPVAREGGKYVETGAGARYDLHQDAQEAREGRLLAPGGYAEVLYAMDPDPEKNVLWRGLRSPIGGAGSLFIDRNLDGEPGPKKGTRKAPAPEPRPPPAGVALAESRPAGKAGTGKNASAPAAPPGGEEGPLPRAARPLAAEVLHLSFAFWTPYTDTWDPARPPRFQKRAQEKRGPLGTWDSTRAVLDEKAPAEEFAWRQVEGSLEDPTDDVFPERVEVTLVLAGNADLPALRLAQEVGPGDRAIPLSSIQGLPEEGPRRLVKIDGEWIGYDRIENGRLLVPTGKSGGRGLRGTSPARHFAGAAVEAGTTFRRVVEIPAVRVGLGPEEKRRRS